MVYTIGGNSVDISKEVSKGSVWKELLFAFIGIMYITAGFIVPGLKCMKQRSIKASIPFFTQGIETDALTSSAHAGHFASNVSGQAPGAHVPWGATAHVLAAAASAPALCCVIERFGRKVGIFIVSLVQGISCIPLLLDVNETTTIILHTLAGVTSGGLFTIFPIYIREISSTRQRGLALSLFIPMTAAGYLMRLAAGFDTLVFLMVGLVVFQMIMVFCLLESPSYLVMIGDYERAKWNVSRLKCLPEEHPTVLEEVASLKDESDRARAAGRLHTITIIKNPIWRDATKIGLILHTVVILGGSVIFLDQEKTLLQLQSTADPDRVLTLVSLCAGSVACAALIRVLERRYLLTAAFSVMALTMGILAVYTQADLTVYTLRWVPVASLGVLVAAYGVAWGLPEVVSAELFNCEAGWSPGPLLPSARRSMGACAWRGRLVLAGGSDGAASLRRVDWLPSAGGAWQSGPPLRRARAGLALAELGGALYAAGGFSGREFLACVEWLPAPGAEWTMLTEPPQVARTLSEPNPPSESEPPPVYRAVSEPSETRPENGQGEASAQ